MADKRLRSIVFPGLADNYTVPQKTTDLEDFSTFAGASIAIIANGNTHAAISADQYVYVYNHNILDDGLYLNISGATIAANVELSTADLEEVTGGGLNALKTSIKHDEGSLAFPITGDTNTTGYTIRQGIFVHLSGHSTLADGYYLVASSIAEGAAFTSSNLTSQAGPVSSGILGTLNNFVANSFTPSISIFAGSTELTKTISYSQGTQIGNLVYVNVEGTFTSQANGGLLFRVTNKPVPSKTFLTGSVSINSQTYFLLHSNGTASSVYIRDANGNVQGTSVSGLSFSISVMYFV